VKKNIKPYQLFLIGIVVILFGTYAINGVSGGVFVFAGLFLWIVAIIGIASRLFNGPNIEKTTQATAKVILSSFLRITEKYQYPIESSSDKQKVYAHVLSLRHGYTDSVIKEVLGKAQEVSKLRGETKGISLNTLAFTIVVREYNLDTHKNLTKEQLNIIQSIIWKLFRIGNE